MTETVIFAAEGAGFAAATLSILMVFRRGRRGGFSLPGRMARLRSEEVWGEGAGADFFAGVFLVAFLIVFLVAIGFSNLGMNCERACRDGALRERP